MIIHDKDLEHLFRNMGIRSDNPYRNSDIFFHDELVYKIYTNKNDVTTYNLGVINKIQKKKKILSSIEELVLPIDIVEYNDNVVGYVTKKINGSTLKDLIVDEKITKEEMKRIFVDISNVIKKINQLDIDLSIGDLHEKNIIIDEKRSVHIIDCDSFVFDKEPLLLDNRPYYGKYINNFYSYEEIESKKINIDGLCFLSIMINSLFCEITDNSVNPIMIAKNDKRFNKIYDLIKRVENDEKYKVEDIKFNDIIVSTQEDRTELIEV